MPTHRVSKENEERLLNWIVRKKLDEGELKNEKAKWYFGMTFDEVLGELLEEVGF